MANQIQSFLKQPVTLRRALVSITLCHAAHAFTYFAAKYEIRELEKQHEHDKEVVGVLKESIDHLLPHVPMEVAKSLEEKLEFWSITFNSYHQD